MDKVKDIWNMLNDMSTKDPLEYQNFVDAQISSFKENGGEEPENPDGSRVTHFRPNAGFVFSSKTTGGDGIKVREGGKVSADVPHINPEICAHFLFILCIMNSWMYAYFTPINDLCVQGKTLYINICHHESIERPKDEKGNIVTNYISSTNGMEIPLVVGNVRGMTPLVKDIQ